MEEQEHKSDSLRNCPEDCKDNVCDLDSLQCKSIDQYNLQSNLIITIMGKKYHIKLKDLPKYIKDVLIHYGGNVEVDGNEITRFKCTLGRDMIHLTDLAKDSFYNILNEQNDIIAFIDASYRIPKKQVPFATLCNLKEQLFQYWRDKTETYRGFIGIKNDIEYNQAKKIQVNRTGNNLYFANFPEWPTKFITMEDARDIMTSQYKVFVLIETQFAYVDTNPSRISAGHTPIEGMNFYAVTPIGIQSKITKYQLFSPDWVNL